MKLIPFIIVLCISHNISAMFSRMLISNGMLKSKVYSPIIVQKQEIINHCRNFSLLKNRYNRKQEINMQSQIPADTFLKKSMTRLSKEISKPIVPQRNVIFDRISLPDNATNAIEGFVKIFMEDYIEKDLYDSGQWKWLNIVPLITKENTLVPYICNYYVDLRIYASQLIEEELDWQKTYHVWEKLDQQLHDILVSRREKFDSWNQDFTGDNLAEYKKFLNEMRRLSS